MIKVLRKDIVLQIQEKYGDFTATEREIADFFILNKEDADFSARTIALRLYVSEAALSRFSKKLAFNGYREFIYEYKLYMNSELRKKDNLTVEVLENYKELLMDAYEIIDDDQMMRIADLISESDKIHVYGIENASLVAREFRMNFMKLGVNIQHITDTSTMEISEMMMDKDTLAIGFSISSGDEADPVIKAVNGAKDKGAKTIMISSNPNIDLCESCDELMLMPEKKNREIRHSVSPKLPMMMIIEILYVHCLNLNWNEPKLVSVERGIIKERVVI